MKPRPRFELPIQKARISLPYPAECLSPYNIRILYMAQYKFPPGRPCRFEFRPFRVWAAESIRGTHWLEELLLRDVYG